MDKAATLASENIKKSLITAVRKGYLKDVKNFLQSYSVSYSETWSDGYVLLVEAIDHRHSKVAKLLIRKGAKVNSHHINDINTPLHLAVRNGDIKLVRILLERGANVHVVNACGYTPLYLAVVNGNTIIVKMLLDSGADLHVKNTRGYTPLHCAVEKCSEEIVTLLLSSDLNVDVRATDGITPLHIAAERKYVQIARVLLNHGADIHSTCTSTQTEGYMPIHFSSQQGTKEAVKLLLSKGADVNANTKDNTTPLHLAVEAQHETVVKLLLEHGANVDAQNNKGKTVLHLAVESGNSTIVKDVLRYRPDINNESNRSSLKTALCGINVKYKKIVEDLLQYGFIVKPEDAANSELLHVAVAKGSLKIVKSLLKFGADINVKDKTGHTPIHYAVRNFHVGITKLLLTNGANTKDCPELLHTAVAKGSLKIVRDLLKHGADVNGKDEGGQTPIYYVVGNFNAEITKLLLANGADIKDCPELLHSAVEAGSLEMIENLLRSGADVNMMDLDDNSKHPVGDTPLHRAAENMSEDVVKLLLNHGANVNAKDEWGNTPIVFAVQNSDVKITKLLLTSGADIKESPELLRIAAAKGSLEIIKDLLKHDADVNCSDTDGRTALHFAVLHQDLYESESSSPAIIDMHDREQIVELLLSKGANVNAKTKNCVTALHTAAGNGYAKIVEVLLKFGAAVDIRDKYGRTALYTAVKGENMEVVNALLEYGSDINVTSNKNHTPLEYAMLGTSLTYDEYDAHYDYDNYNDYDYPLDFDYYDYALDYDSDDYDDDYDNYHYKYDFYDSDESNFSVDDYQIHDVDGSDSDDNIRVFVSRGKIVELLKQHIVKLKIAGLYVSKRNSQLIGTDFRLTAFGDGCEEEVEMMKGEKIGNSCASFYDILTRTTHQLAIYAKNENIVRAIKSADYKTKFRTYAGMIEAKFRRGVERKELMELGNQFFCYRFKSLPELPLPCVEQIFSYLSNNDLKVLHTCA